MGNATSVGREIRDELSRTIRDAMLRLLYNLISATPVDTHHLQSNWVVTFKRPFTGVDGSRKQVSFAAENAGLARLMRYDVVRDGNIHLRNNVSYLPYVAAGSSPQAAAGWIDRAIEGAASMTPPARRPAVRHLFRRLQGARK